MQTTSLWRLTEGERLRYLGAVLAMVIFGGFLFSGPLIGKGVIDLVVAWQDMAPGTGPDPEAEAPPGFELLHRLSGGSAAEPRVWGYLLLSGTAVVLMSAIGGVFLYLRGRWAAVASERIVHRLRRRLFDHLEHLPARFHDGADTGDLVQRCSSDLETLRVFLATDVIDIGRAILLVLAVLPFMLALSPALTIVSVGLLPPIAFFAWLFFRKVQAVFRLTDESEAAMTAMLQENLTGVRVVRAFAREDYEREKFAALNARFRDHNRLLLYWMAIYWSCSDLLCLAQIGLVLLIGGLWALQGDLSPGTLFAFYTYVTMIIWPIRQMGRVLTDSGKAVVSLARVHEVLADAHEHADETDHAEPDQPLRGELRIDGLWFRYPAPHRLIVTRDGPASAPDPTAETATAPSGWVLQDISLHVRPGETVGIVGPPGAGKSTLIAVLLRLYDHERGEIELDGVPLRQLPRQWLRRQFATVFQDPFLYSRTLRENLLLGHDDSSTAELDRVIDAAALRSTVDGFRDGLQTLVGERGTTLSGGQRQRTALARALLKPAGVLVLDDSLSAVDAGTEAEILGHLAAARGERTTLIIAHRLSAVRHADRIVVLDRGRIVQTGDHDTLARQPGPYRRLCELQDIPVAPLDAAGTDSRQAESA